MTWAVIGAYVLVSLTSWCIRSQICEVEFTTFRLHVILQVLKLFSIREKITEVWTVIHPHAKFEKAAPQVKLTTSTKVSSLHLVTTAETTIPG